MSLTVQFHGYPTKQSTHTIRFTDLVKKLQLAGYPITRSARGPHEAPELAVGISGPVKEGVSQVIDITELSVKPYERHRGLNCILTFSGLKEALGKKGIAIQSSERCEGGRGTELAQRFYMEGKYKGIADVIYIGSDGQDPDPEGSGPGSPGRELVQDRPRGAGFLKDAQCRKAIEDHAVRIVMDHYRKLHEELKQDGKIKDTGKQKPYDLEMIIDGDLVRVEVKGTQRDGEEVILTKGEVENALGQKGDEYRVDLAVVTGIQVEMDASGNWSVTRDGALLPGHPIQDWKPSEDDLTPTQYRYKIPHQRGRGGQRPG